MSTDRAVELLLPGVGRTAWAAAEKEATAKAQDKIEASIFFI